LRHLAAHASRKIKIKPKASATKAAGYFLSHKPQKSVWIPFGQRQPKKLLFFESPARTIDADAGIYIRDIPVPMKTARIPARCAPGLRLPSRVRRGAQLKQSHRTAAPQPRPQSTDARDAIIL